MPLNFNLQLSVSALKRVFSLTNLEFWISHRKPNISTQISSSFLRLPSLLSAFLPFHAFLPFCVFTSTILVFNLNSPPTAEVVIKSKDISLNILSLECSRITPPFFYSDSFFLSYSMPSSCFSFLFHSFTSTSPFFYNQHPPPPPSTTIAGFTYWTINFKLSLKFLISQLTYNFGLRGHTHGWEIY